jgi:SAM-dependent methyltransferase
MRYFEDVYTANPRPYGDGPSEAAKLLSEFLLKSTLGQRPTVVDLGCGYGRDCVFLAKQGCDVTGVDTSRRGILTAQMWARKENLDIKFMTKDIMESGIAEKSFDGLLCAGVLEYLDPRRRPRVGHEFWRLARPGGTISLLCLATDDPDLGKGKDMGDNSWEVRMGLQVHFFTEREIRSLFPDFVPKKLEVITIHEDFPEPKDHRYWFFLGQRP